MITFSAIAAYLPPGSLEFVGNNQVKLNLNQITGDSLTLDASAVKGVLKILEALTQLTLAINTARAAANPSLAPIEFCEKHLAGTVDAPNFQYIVTVGINPQSFINNVVDPTA
ncbi:MAG: hypothetical protein V7K48_34700 [Nostoc sp.]|uniref:hypothetical protein n=1 Tax=Nostoc sp. TaxID=1180 RepID=UPI002FF53B3A